MAEPLCKCKYFSDCNIINGGCCSHPQAQREFGKTISLIICDACPWYDGESRGLGDDVHKVTKALGLDKAAKLVQKVTRKPCGCEERRRRWNEKYGRRKK